MIKLSIDAMGGDHGIDSTVPAAIDVLDSHANVKLVLVGDESRLLPAFSSLGWKPGNRLEIRHATQVVGMDENPAHALRKKKDSSMRVAINLVRDGEVHGCVSAGNTGALMATARFVLRTIQGIDRPAICAAVFVSWRRRSKDRRVHDTRSGRKSRSRRERSDRHDLSWPRARHRWAHRRTSPLSGHVRFSTVCAKGLGRIGARRLAGHHDRARS